MHPQNTHSIIANITYWYSTLVHSILKFDIKLLLIGYYYQIDNLDQCSFILLDLFRLYL